MSQKIKEYWDKRAKQSAGALVATTNDVYLRELEISIIIQTIHELHITDDSRVLDVGCGDGYSTLKIAKTFPMIRFLGIDYSEQMIVEAIKHLVGYSNLNATFLLGDVLELGKVCNDKVYDIVLTDRCLINLDSFESQCHAIVQIAKHTKLGGYYIAIENFVEGHENMNKARQAVGLPEIPVRWHNLYFKEKEFIQSVGQFFEIIAFKDFSSSYYFATRVVYSAMCHMRGEEPDYNHEIHQLSVKLPWVGQFSPIRMVVLHRKSK